MNKIIKTILITLVFTLASCDQNDDVVTPLNQFSTEFKDYETPNCYIEFDNDNQTEFNLFFLNGRMFDNDNPILTGSTKEYLFSVNTSNFVFFNITSEENPSIITPSYPNIQTGVSYIGHESDTAIVHNFAIQSAIYTTNGFNFGEPDETTGVAHLPVSSNLPTITINSYNFDSTTQTGTINVDYTFPDTTGDTITGHYEGTLGVFLD